MAVPNGNDHLKNTSNGTFTGTTEGGTILGNTTSTSIITNTLALKDNAANFGKTPGPVELANGLVANTKSFSSGTFKYLAAGKYVIRTISDTLSGVSDTNMLIPGSDSNSRRSIHAFEHDFGAKMLSAFRANRFSWTSTKSYNTAGASLGSRVNWVAATTAGGDSASVPATLSTTYMYDISDTDATDKAVDSAATPTRTIPGELVMKVDFVTLSVSSGGDFFDYKAITGK